MVSRPVTLNAAEVSTLPFTLTSPASIIRSISRREATPARARYLAIRSPPSLHSASVFGGRGALFWGAGLRAPDGFRFGRPVSRRSGMGSAFCLASGGELQEGRRDGKPESDFDSHPDR